MLQVSLHKYFQIVLYTSWLIFYLFNTCWCLCSTFNFSLTHFFSFCNELNFILLARDKTKEYLLVSHRMINYQTFLARACIIVYQLIQGQCPHSYNPQERGLRKRASVRNEPILINCKIVLEWNTQYCMKKTLFWCLRLSLLLTKPVFQIPCGDTIAGDIME